MLNRNIKYSFHRRKQSEESLKSLKKDKKY